MAMKDLLRHLRLRLLLLLLLLYLLRNLRGLGGQSGRLLSPLRRLHRPLRLAIMGTINGKKERKGKRRKKPRMTLSWKSMRAHLQSEAGLLMGYVSPRPSAILPRP